MVANVPGRDLTNFQKGFIVTTTAAAGLSGYTCLQTNLSQLRLNRQKEIANIRKDYRNNPSPYHYLEGHIKIGVEPTKALVSLGHEPPVFNKRTGQYEDFSDLLKKGSSSLNSMVTKQEQSVPALFIDPKYRVKTPVAKIVVHDPGESKTPVRPPTRRIEFTLQNQSAPSVHSVGEKKSSFLREVQSSEILYPKSQTSSFVTPVNSSFVSQSSVLEEPYFIAKGPSFSHTEAGIVTSFLIFSCVWICLLYFLVSRFTRAAVKYVVTPRLKVDILKLYSLRQLSYESAVYLLVTDCNLDRYVARSLLESRPLKLRSDFATQEFLADPRALLDVQERLKFPLPPPSPFTRRRSLNTRGWIVVGIFCFFVLFWLVQAITN